MVCHSLGKRAQVPPRAGAGAGQPRPPSATPSGPMGKAGEGLGVIVVLLPETNEFARINGPFGIGCNARRRREPRLRFAQPLVRNRLQTARLVERPRLDDDDVGVLHRRSPQSCAARGAHLSSLGSAIRKTCRVPGGSTVQHFEVLAPDDHRQGKRASGPSLAVGAVAGIEREGPPVHAVPNSAAEALTGVRGHGGTT